ncbi:MAG TPA: MarR family transcriptional regulator [Mycobacteriales bacterium]|nr:MarR family transcriptional regulator [Mycobacteriales bacterium]
MVEPVLLDPALSRRISPETDPADKQALLNLLRLADATNHVYASLLRPHGLSQTGLNVLTILATGPADPRPAWVAERLLLTTGTITTVLDTLERRGLIRRQQHPSDRRKVTLSLTRSGRALVPKVHRELDRFEQALLAALRPTERRTLDRLLRRLCIHLDEATAR